MNPKIEAARAALGEVRSGMTLGLGTGSTAYEFVRLLGDALRDGWAEEYRALVEEVRPLPGAVEGCPGTWNGQCAALYATSTKKGRVAFPSMKRTARAVMRSVMYPESRTATPFSDRNVLRTFRRPSETARERRPPPARHPASARSRGRRWREPDHAFRQTMSCQTSDFVVIVNSTQRIGSCTASFSLPAFFTFGSLPPGG